MSSIYTLSICPGNEYKNVWRRIEISGQATLDMLCNAILDSFNFIHEHLYEYFLSGKPGGEPDFTCCPDPGQKSTREKIDSAKLVPGQTFLLHYDFGDDWLFSIKVESIIASAAEIIPRVIDGEGELTQYPEYDIDSELKRIFEEDEDDDFEMSEDNLRYMSEFEEDISGLSEATVEMHLSNVAFFLNVYLPQYELSMQDGPQEIRGFLGDFLIYDCMWSSPSGIKKNAASLKKFYKSMLLRGYIEKAAYDDMCAVIKEELPEWQERCRRYDEEDFDEDSDDWDHFLW